MKAQQWQVHIDACDRSSESKSAYAKKHGLVYSQFLYWTRKLAPEIDSSDFVAVELKPKIRAIEGLGVLEFPNGIRLVIHHSDLLSVLPGLLDIRIV